MRHPVDVPIVFATQRERGLYDRIDELCRRFYRLGTLPPGERAGIGFLVAVFRKRLASSFSAFSKSLERRRDFIVGLQQDDTVERLKHGISVDASQEEDEDDRVDVDALLDIERRRMLALRRDRLEQELDYLRDYIADLRQIAEDSKFAAFREQLDHLLAAGHRVIVFTQYLDTMDFIRDQLVAYFADRIVCYSGRGGEVWDPDDNRWRMVPKAEVKSRSRQDHPRCARILLGTDAASEGLNLQEFSALINYDLPWNPMRVEQRIGRIDRIGQEAPRVTIVNLYLQGSIEQDTYEVLRQRIGFFEEVVGPLQPILAQVPRIFRSIAMGEMERAEARRELAELAARGTDAPLAALESYVRVEDGVTSDGLELQPASQTQLAAWCLQHTAPEMRLTVCPEPGASSIQSDGVRACFRLTWPAAPPNLGVGPTDEVLVTFDPALADRNPPTAPSEDEYNEVQRGSEGVRLLTWGDPLLQAWLMAVRGDELIPEELAMAGCVISRRPLEYLRVAARPSPIMSFGDLQAALRQA